ncbi:hypothetical protein [Aeromicrobium wangtongii]|uniref:Secreted protein n=1 Tax=Aeromicrobium wangtongii TaxID=2969247 RepID=A0ABY5M2X6_9ACTN|nr:hypothetical protein [Aeromicrobium wangtongii]MCD9198529.1 hypothetical protein [Aeromicrobium wangtongii]UUP12555.1 hypothetical protein NQV15_11895 [Aeromicrobium wangtongii]
MKGCVAVLAFMVFGAAVLVGVAIAVERRGTAKSEPLTGTTSEVELTDYEPKSHGRKKRHQGADIEYLYVAGGRTFQSSTWLSRTTLSDRVVCFDPDDPAVHAIRGNPQATCGEANHGETRRAVEVAAR